MGIWLIVLVAYALGWRPESFRFPAQNTHQPSAVDVLKSRYAKGEINREEFKTMLRDLEKH